MISSKSIRAKIKNIADANNIDFQSCVTRFLHERLLYRVSVSEYKESLILKGGNLIYSIFNLKARPTIDVDLLGIALKNDADECLGAFRSILSIECDDTVWFDTDNMNAEIISEQNQYHGIRLHIQTGFDTIKQQVQIDIGFGDTITPEPIDLNYPNLLSELPESKLLAYTNETVIAEKFQAMIFLADFNSRMKDFYDVYTILKSGKYNLEILKKAVKVTFANRKTELSPKHTLFTYDFVQDPQRNKMWKAFLRKINIHEDIEFSEIMKTISDNLLPILENKS